MLSAGFSGKAVAISKSMFKNILSELHKSGYHISEQYLEAFEIGGYDDYDPAMNLDDFDNADDGDDDY
jgi:hypothetical protein